MYVYVEIGQSLSISLCFRIMDGKFHGKGYIARIKNEDSFEAYDELYAVVYKGKDTVNFNLFKSICCTHNSKFFYPQKVNNKSSFTIEEAVTAMNNFPMKGADGLYFVSHPLTFAQFGFLAYDHGILTSESGLRELGGRRDIVQDESNTVLKGNENSVSETLESEAVDDCATKGLPNAIKAAREKAGILFPRYEEECNEDVFDFESHGDHDPDSLNEFEDEDDKGSEVESVDDHLEISFDSLNERCLLAEAKVKSLETLVAEKEASITALKAELDVAISNNQKFMSAADLANTKVREFRAGNASELVAGLQPEFAVIKGVSNKLATLVNNVNTAKADHSALLIETLQILEDLPDTVKQALSEVTIKTSDTALTEAVKENSKMVEKIVGALEKAGITSDIPTVDLPLMIRDIHSKYPLHCNRESQCDPVTTVNQCTQTESSNKDGLIDKGQQTPIWKKSKARSYGKKKNHWATGPRSGLGNVQEFRRNLFGSSEVRGSPSFGDYNRPLKKTRFLDGQGSWSNAGSSTDNERDVRARSIAFPVWAPKPQNF